jgi:hypothetical protein
VYPPHLCNTSVQSPETIPKADDFHIHNFPDVNSLKVINFPPLIPQQHWTSLKCIGTGLCDTMAPSAVMWTPSYGRLGTGRLGTVILSISFVV